MKQFEEIGIRCDKVVIRQEDVEIYGNDILNDTRVCRIDDNCFRDNEEITELIIPTHITKLGLFSFSKCQNLTKVVIPTSIKEIPYCCFEHCYSLYEIKLPKFIKIHKNNFPNLNYSETMNKISYETYNIIRNIGNEILKCFVGK